MRQPRVAERLLEDPQPVPTGGATSSAHRQTHEGLGGAQPQKAAAALGQELAKVLDIEAMAKRAPTEGGGPRRAALPGRPPTGCARSCWPTSSREAASSLPALVPRVQAGEAEWFEVPSVARDDGHLGGLGDGGDESVAERSVFGESVGGQDARGG